MPFIEIPFQDPVAAFAPWADDPWSMLLDSSGGDGERGRYSYMAIRPFRTILARNGVVSLDGETEEIDPFAALKRELLAFPRPAGPSPLPFSGGAIGCFGYELGHHLERAPIRHAAGQTEMAVGLFDMVAGFDLAEQRAYIHYARGEDRERALALADKMARPCDPPVVPPAPLGIVCRPEMDRETYLERVRRIIGFIRAGEVYQVNFTQRFLARMPEGLSPFGLFRRLRAINPAPFGAFLRLGDDLTLASASPERFLALDRRGRIEARPIKGTRKRLESPMDDARMAAELVACGKDRAENLMIADLLRNDIGRVARIGSVKVPALARLETYASVHHLVSVVTGTLRPGLKAVDLLRAAFPGGSVTGAPKVRAMEIIDELEPAPRGPYCGAVGWLGFDGAMDTSIVIRALTITRDMIVAQAGGGIVAESDPMSEHAEMLTKVAPALAALGIG